MLDARACIGTHDVLLVTLDTLRHDVAADALASGRTPNLQRLLPNGVWEKRHSPATFTYAAHHAFFAGFLPTPASAGPHPRLFATAFPGSTTVCEETCVLDAPEIVSGLAERGYHTICIGGVGFFNRRSPLGCVLPDLFRERHWTVELGVTSAVSTELQVALAVERLSAVGRERRVFLFLNVSALHQPNCLWTAGTSTDSPETQEDALAYVDRCLPPLFEAFRRRGPTLAVLCSDHGTTYGEDGYHGHRLAHPVVWEVPYAELILEAVG